MTKIMSASLRCAGFLSLDFFCQKSSYDENEKLKGRAVTDKKGRYALILNEGEYDLKAKNSDNKTADEQLVIKKKGIVYKDLVVK